MHLHACLGRHLRCGEVKSCLVDFPDPCFGPRNSVGLLPHLRDGRSTELEVVILRLGRSSPPLCHGLPSIPGEVPEHRGER
jgi:hypothetical protein